MSAWEKVAPWLAGAAAIAMLIVPIGGYILIHEGQQTGQEEVTRLINAFDCQQKAFNGILQDVPLLVDKDTIAHDYATIAKQCKVAEAPAG